jgi:hypothetical protein
MSTASPSPAAQAIELPVPHAAGAHPAGEAAPSASHSLHPMRPDPLPLERLSALLWAGHGIHRVASWGRRAPPPQSWQEVTLYALLPQGTYRYEPHEHRLLLVHEDDLRASADARDLHGAAPLHLLYVVDFEPLHPGDEEHGVEADAQADAGRIVEKISHYCAGAGLASEVRGVANRTHLARALGLKPSQRIALAQTVGFPHAGAR